VFLWSVRYRRVTANAVRRVSTRRVRTRRSPRGEQPYAQPPGAPSGGAPGHCVRCAHTTGVVRMVRQSPTTTASRRLARLMAACMATTSTTWRITSSIDGPSWLPRPCRWRCSLCTHARAPPGGCVRTRNTIGPVCASACGGACPISPTRPAAPRIPRPTVLRRAAVGPPRRPFHSCAGDGGDGHGVRRGRYRSGLPRQRSRSRASGSSAV